MDTSYYIVAALLGAVLMLIEHRVARARGIDAYRFEDTVNSLSNFLGELVLTAVLYLNVFYAYHLLESHVGWLDVDATHWATWVLSFAALDLVYYVGHRACHRVGALWALHTVHHQSNEYNLAVGFRGPMLSALQIAPFMVPLALIGVPSAVLFPLYAVHTVWKLLVHTKVVGSLGPLETIFITPSQHRVHHARNEQYLDKNFGGVFNLWDRAFGTFELEIETPAFGPATALQNLDPIHNNVEPWRQLARQASGRGMRGWSRALLGPARFSDDPEAAPDLEALPLPAEVHHARVDVSPKPLDTAALPDGRDRAMLVLRLLGASAVTLLMLQFTESVPLLVAAALGIAVLTTLARVGRVLSAPPVRVPTQRASMPCEKASAL